MSREAQLGERTGQGLSGVSAEFVASLGKKVADARGSLGALEADLGSKTARDELRRKLHAMGTGAKMLRFDAMALALAEAQGTLEALGKDAPSRKALVELAKVLDDLPALVWSSQPLVSEPKPVAVKPTAPKVVAEPKVVEAPAVVKAAEPEPEPVEAPAPALYDPEFLRLAPVSALVVGPDSLAELLAEDVDPALRPVEIERTDDAQVALDLARALAPDVVILDAQIESAPELVEALSDDPLSESVPVVVVGTMSAESAGRFLALGVARTLTWPFSADALRTICEEVVDQRDNKTVRVALGEPTVEQLGDRLAAEVRRALVESVALSSRGQRVSLGEGTEVMAAIWGAIARVREVVTARTGGEVRFAGRGPEGTAMLAPWMNPDMPGADRARPRGRGAATDVVLEGRRVLVADDDPGVTWFLADLLRAAGCVVFEALDGAAALDVAMRESPDLVISDILMPRLDGFALSRALKRDVALRDTPVILLSWKEDLLQRVRELGAGASAYLRKETDARSVMARVREALWPKARVEARLKGTGEIRGRLDGVTARSLLELVCAVRPNARVSVRDASCLYEIEIRDGAPRRASKTSPEGNFTRGEGALAALLGVGAGRFVVSPVSSAPLEGELTGTLASQLAGPIAAARGALALVPAMLVGPRVRLELDPEMLPSYLASTPEPTRTLVRLIAEGHYVSDVLSAGSVMPSLVEDLLSDLAARGAILSAETEDGDDLLPGAISDALAVWKGAASRTPAEKFGEDPLALLLAEAAPSLAPAEAQAPSSLADAVMKEISDRSPAPVAHVSSSPPPIVEPSALKPRSTPPAEDRTENESLVEAHVLTPSVPISEEVDEDDELAASADEAPEALEPPARTPMAAEAARRQPPKSGGAKWLVAAAMLGVLGFAAVRVTNTPSLAASPVAAPTSEVSYADPPQGATVGKSEGWLDVSAPAGVAVLVDGVERGRGGAHFALASGFHDVAVGARVRSVLLRDGKSARLDLSAP